MGNYHHTRNYKILIEQTQFLLVTAATVHGKQSASVAKN